MGGVIIIALSTGVLGQLLLVLQSQKEASMRAHLQDTAEDPLGGFSDLLRKMVPELKARLTEQLLKKQTASM